MKSSILLVIVFVNFNLKSQSNLNFEKWTNNGSYYDLDEWNTSNMFFKFGANINCTRQKPYSGIFSLGISPTFFMGNSSAGFASQKFKYSQQAKSVRLYYRYKSGIYDSAGLELEFYKGYSKDTNNKIGKAILYLTPKNNWTYIACDIVWKNSQLPDSAFIVIHNSYKNNKDTLFVDDLSLSLFGSNTNQFTVQNYRVFINLKNQLVLIDSSFRETDYIVLIKNNIGQVLLNLNTSNKTVELDNLQTGLYIYEIFDNYKRVTYGKFIKM